MKQMLVAVVLALISSAWGEAPKAIFLSQSAGFVHDVVKRNGTELSLAEKTLESLAPKAGLSLECTQDAATLTPEKIKAARLLIFYTTGELPMSEEAFSAMEQWLSDGGAILGIHAATDTFYKPPFHDRWMKIINGQFDGHPWTADKSVVIKRHETAHPAAKPIPQGWTIKEEIYQTKEFDPAVVRVLIGLDMELTALKKPRHVPIAWCRELGKGKVLYTSLGHNPEVWKTDIYQDHLIGAMKWLLGQAPGDATPNPDLSAAEQAIAERVAPK